MISAENSSFSKIFNPIPTIADSIFRVSKLTIPSVKMPHTFFPFKKTSLTHLIFASILKSFFKVLQTATAENALDVVMQLLEKAKTDSVEYDAEIADMSKKLEDSENKYKALQVDYIQKFTNSSSDVVEEEDDEDAVEKEIEDIMKDI